MPKTVWSVHIPQLDVKKKAFPNAEKEQNKVMKKKKFKSKLRRDYASRDQRALPTAFSGSKVRRTRKKNMRKKELLLPDAYSIERNGSTS